jgi:hypothetical protein
VNTEWDTAGNWVGGVPGPNDWVRIDRGPNAPVIKGGTTVQIESFVSGGALGGFDPVLFLNGTLIVTAGFSEWKNGELRLSGTLIVQNNATFEWQGGQITAPPAGGTPQILVKHGEMIIEKDASNLHASIVVGGHGEDAKLITRDMDKNLILHRGLQILVQEQGEFQIKQTTVNANQGNIKQPGSPTAFATIELVNGGRLVREGAGSPTLQQAISVGALSVLEVKADSGLSVDLREPFNMSPGDPATYGVRLENFGHFLVQPNSFFGTDRPAALMAQGSLMTLSQSATADTDILFSGDLLVVDGILQFGNGPAANFVNLHMLNGNVGMQGGKLAMRVDGQTSGRSDAIVFDDLTNPLGAFFIGGPNVILRVETLRQASQAGWGYVLISRMADPQQQFAGFLWAGFNTTGYNRGTSPVQPHPFSIWI